MQLAIGALAVVLAVVLGGTHSDRQRAQVPAGANVGHLTRALAAFNCHPASALNREHLDAGADIRCAPLSADDRRQLWVTWHGFHDGNVLFALRTTLGGSGSWLRLAWVTPEAVGTVQFDDEREIESIAWPPTKASTVAVTMRTHGPEDPLCCPKTVTPGTLHMRDGQLTLTQP